MPAPPLESEPAMVTAIAVMARVLRFGALARIRHDRRAFQERSVDDARSSRAAAVGSGASDSAEITETPSTPAMIVAAALSFVDARNRARSGNFRCDRGTRDDLAQARQSRSARADCSSMGRVDAADADIVDHRERRRPRVLDGLHRQPNERRRPELLARRNDIACRPGRDARRRRRLRAPRRRGH